MKGLLVYVCAIQVFVCARRSGVKVKKTVKKGKPACVVVCILYGWVRTI